MFQSTGFCGSVDDLAFIINICLYALLMSLIPLTGVNFPNSDFDLICLVNDIPKAQRCYTSEIKTSQELVVFQYLRDFESCQRK